MSYLDSLVLYKQSNSQSRWYSIGSKNIFTHWFSEGKKYICFSIFAYGNMGEKYESSPCIWNCSAFYIQTFSNSVRGKKYIYIHMQYIYIYKDFKGFYCKSELPELFVNLLCPIFYSLFLFIRSGVILIICISSKSPSDADTANQRPCLENHWFKVIWDWDC